MNADYLGEEKIPRLLLKMCTQTTMSVLLYSIYSIMDTYFVSTGVSEFAAGGVSVAAPLLTILGAVSTTVGGGGASIISRALGKGEQENAANVAANAMLIFWIFALIYTVLGLLFLRPLLYLLGTTNSLLPYTEGYARIILLGAISSTGFSAIIRAEGDTKYSLYMWVVPVIVNLILDPMFINIFEWGVEGAAIATVCAQLISMGMSLYFFYGKKRNTYVIKPSDFQLRWHIVKEIFVIGFPSLVLQFSLSVSTILVNNILRSQGGDVAISAYGIISRIQMFLIMPQNGIIQGMQPIVGYNYGRGSYERVREALRLSAVALFGYSCIATCLGYLFRWQLIGLFIQDELLIVTAFTVLFFLLLTLPIKGIPTLVSSYYQAIGKAKLSIIIPVVNALVIQVPILYIMSRLMAATGIWLSFAAGDILSIVFAGIIYFIERKD